jgi:maltose alpha-D-glucosyltransferase/alpha-amylase
MAGDTTRNLISPDPLWYKDAIIYEMHVRAFYDSNGDGVGDFAGLTRKLDYLQDLGINAIWLLPFYPSPLHDDGYDISDYNGINPLYGSMRDFKTFVREAHKRGLRVITELVCNHTSIEHPWFQRARQAKPGSVYRDYYVWSDSPEKYQETRIIFKDFEPSNWSWDSVANAYYWHRFYRHQPDLNFDNPRVQKEIFKAMDFWLKMGVDGLRLDAIPYLYQREGTNCENLPETHEFLKRLRQHVDDTFDSRMLLAEANQWPEDAVAYFGEGDECHMCFHFPLMPRLFMAIHMESRFPVIDILAQTPSIPDTAQWAIFLRNHDELTLEMVTDEERDYMYRIYANDPLARINLGIRRRLAPLLNNNRRRIELMNGLLFALPGTPVIYYGDEIGMGDNIYLGDRNGVRTPMQWSPDRNAGFSTANRQQLYLPVITDAEYHYEALNVATQQRNTSSLLWWMKRLISLRKQYKAFGRGSIEFLNPENRKVLAFIRRYEEEIILMVANLSRFSQGVELDLSHLHGMEPIEMFGRIAFPPIGELPYFVTLGPHSFFLFSIEPQRVDNIRGSAGDQLANLPFIATRGTWKSVFSVSSHARLAEVLTQSIQTRRWFGGKARAIRKSEIVDAIPVVFDSAKAYIVLLHIDYMEGQPETYVLPLAYAEGERAVHIQEHAPHTLFATIRMKDGGGLLYDAMSDSTFCRSLLSAITNNRRIDSERGTITASPTPLMRQTYLPTRDMMLEPQLVRAEQSNTSVIFGNRLILKLFRRTDEGSNPEVEVGRFLSEQTTFQHSAPVTGMIAYTRKKEATPMMLAVMHGYRENESDAWEYTLDILRYYLEQAAARQEVLPTMTEPYPSLVSISQQELPSETAKIIGPYLASAQLMGQRTAELHRALCINNSHRDFAIEPFTPHYQRSLYQSIRTRIKETFDILRKQMRQLPDHIQDEASLLLNKESCLINRVQQVLTQTITAKRTRCHGDYHLGQVLYTGGDFYIIDFEGEPARSLAERRIKRSPLVDVACMIRSFQYAAYTALSRQVVAGGLHREQDQEILRPWVHFWHHWVSAAFLSTYLETAAGAAFLPDGEQELAGLLDCYMLDKAIYELGYELNNRPEWLYIPIYGINRIVQDWE